MILVSLLFVTVAILAFQVPKNVTGACLIMYVCKTIASVKSNNVGVLQISYMYVTCTQVVTQY